MTNEKTHGLVYVQNNIKKYDIEQQCVGVIMLAAQTTPFNLGQWRNITILELSIKKQLKRNKLIRSIQRIQKLMKTKVTIYHVFLELLINQYICLRLS